MTTRTTNTATTPRFAQRRHFGMGLGFGLKTWNAATITAPTIAARKAGLKALDHSTARKVLP